MYNRPIKLVFLLGLFFSLFSFFFFSSQAQAVSNFIKFPGNPILSPTVNTWDGQIVLGPTVLYEDGLYKMWYSGGNGGSLQIGYATSTDGVTWTKYAQNPVLSPTSLFLSEQHVTSPSIIKDEGIYKMWYQSTTGTGFNYYISYATSTDGISWTQHGPVNLPKQGWESGGHADAAVLKVGSTYHMWYTTNNGTWKISYASSTDGINWTPYAQNPVVSANQPWEQIDAAAPGVVYDGTHFHMYYHNGGIIGGGGISYAYSTNGINWTKPAALNRAITPSGGWDAGEYHSFPLLINGQTNLYFSAVNDSNTTFQIGLATGNPQINPPFITDVTGPAEPVSLGTEAQIEATFTDADVNQLHTVTIDWGDDTITSANATYSNGAGLAIGGHTYESLGNYEVTVTVIDSAGLQDTWTYESIRVRDFTPEITNITAPLDPTAITNSVTIQANFTDQDLQQTHTSIVDWGDGTTSAATVSESNGSGVATGTHTYAAAGVYSLSVTVTDSAGRSDSEVYQYVVIFNPEAGYVAGHGSITSPPGAYTANPTLSGKASFGFVSKYLNGASTPSGDTKFIFKTADFSFTSSSYDWLVVAGSKAQYKGSGQINGVGDYGFMLTAIDGATNNQDAFRLKIYDKLTESVVYDNQIGAGQSEDPTTLVNTGSINIHR